MEQPTLTASQHYCEKQETIVRECFLGLKSIVLSVDKNIVHIRKYQIPFFRYKEFNLGFFMGLPKENNVKIERCFLNPPQGEKRPRNDNGS